MADLTSKDANFSAEDDNPPISQDMESTGGQVQKYEDTERITITLGNLVVVQVGESNEVANVYETNERRGRREKLQAKEESRFKFDSVSDKAATEAPSKAEIELSREDNAICAKDRDNRQTEALLEYPIPLIARQGSMRTLKYVTIVKLLVRLQDNGKFDEHERCACAILESSPIREDPDMKATVLMERGVAFYYANDLKKCKQLFNAAIRMGGSLVNRSLLEAKALYLKSAAYRREGKYNKALKCLQQAELLLCHHESGGDKAELYYNYGTFWLHYYGTKPSHNKGREVFRQKAKESFQKAIEHGARDSNVRVRIKMMSYYNLRIAALYLDCSSKMARQTPKPLTGDVEEAEKRLDFVEYQLGDGMPLGTRVELLKSRSDQHYRQGNLRLAIEAAEEGLKIALKLEKNSSMSSLIERLQELQAIEDATPCTTSGPLVKSEGDSGFSGDCSSD